MPGTQVPGILPFMGFLFFTVKISRPGIAPPDAFLFSNIQLSIPLLFRTVCCSQSRMYRPARAPVIRQLRRPFSLHSRGKLAADSHRQSLPHPGGGCLYRQLRHGGGDPPQRKLQPHRRLGIRQPFRLAGGGRKYIPKPGDNAGEYAGLLPAGRILLPM